MVRGGERLSVDALAAAGSADVAVGVLWGEADALSLARPGVPRADLIQRQLLRDGGEELTNVLGRLSGRLEEEEAGLVGVRLGIGGGDGALVWLFVDEIELVAGEGDDDVLVRLALQFLHPGLGLIERGLWVRLVRLAWCLFHAVKRHIGGTKEGTRHTDWVIS